MANLRLIAASMAAVVVLGAGCSSDKKTNPSSSTIPSASKSGPKMTPAPTPTPVDTAGDVLYEKALTALQNSTAFHAKVGSSSASAAATAINFDIHFGASGSQTTLSASGTTLNLVSDGTNVYMQAPVAFWASLISSTASNSATIASTLASKWVKIDTSLQGFSSYAVFTSKAQYVNSLKASNVHFGLGGSQTINGIATTKLTGSDGSDWYVEADGRPIQTTGAGANGGTGTVTIDQYDVPFSPPLPTASQVLDYKTVTGAK